MLLWAHRVQTSWNSGMMLLNLFCSRFYSWTNVEFLQKLSVRVIHVAAIRVRTTDYSCHKNLLCNLWAITAFSPPLLLPSPKQPLTYSLSLEFVIPGILGCSGTGVPPGKPGPTLSLLCYLAKLSTPSKLQSLPHPWTSYGWLTPPDYLEAKWYYRDRDKLKPWRMLHK